MRGDEPLINLGVCAAEESRYSMSTLSAAHIQYVVVTVAQNRSAAQTPSRGFHRGEFPACAGMNRGPGLPGPDARPSSPHARV